MILLPHPPEFLYYSCTPLHLACPFCLEGLCSHNLVFCLNPKTIWVYWLFYYINNQKHNFNWLNSEFLKLKILRNLSLQWRFSSLLNLYMFNLRSQCHLQGNSQSFPLIIYNTISFTTVVVLQQKSGADKLQDTGMFQNVFNMTQNTARKTKKLANRIT
jgi:hypothetical protein